MIMKRVTAIESEIIGLNVGGREIMTSKETLCTVPGSKLSKLFTDAHRLSRVMGKNSELIFLDRNGHIFEHVIDYLRDQRKAWPYFKDQTEEIRFIKELEFWGIEQHATPQEHSNSPKPKLRAALPARRTNATTLVSGRQG